MLDAFSNTSALIVALFAVCIFAVLLIVYLRSRSKRDAQNESADRMSPNKFDTTLGEFHDMREALRPLQHTRAASRSLPGKQS